jgi:oligopeptide transport system ATP-binding protein
MLLWQATFSRKEKLMLEVRNLKKYFPVKGSKTKVVHAVEDLSLEIPKGKTFGLVGESGCGKSTVARTVIRIYEPTAGTILLDNMDISHIGEKGLKPMRRKMQMIFQDPYASLNARMKVRDIIAEPLAAHALCKTDRETDEMVLSILSRVGLGRQHMNRYPHEFSGGQRQRIGIARALILNPELLICDEPISALDVSIQSQVVNLLRTIQEEKNLSYLFIAHDLAMVRYVSDLIGVMYLGRLVEVCESVEIYKKPLHPYTIGLMDSVPLPRPVKKEFVKEASIEGDIPSPISPPSGCAFHTRCKRAKPECGETVPVLKEVETGHKVACCLF